MRKAADETATMEVADEGRRRVAVERACARPIKVIKVVAVFGPAALMFCVGNVVAAIGDVNDRVLMRRGGPFVPMSSNTFWILMELTIGAWLSVLSWIPAVLYRVLPRRFVAWKLARCEALDPCHSCLFELRGAAVVDGERRCPECGKPDAPPSPNPTEPRP